MDIRLKKKEARQLLREKRDAISKEDKARLDTALNAAIIACATFRFSDTLLVYYPKGSECDVLPTVKEALMRGKRVAFPRCEDKGVMTFHEICSLDELSRGRFGIPEPSINAPVCTATQASLCLVPGLSFDTAGYRMGYGGGYYDRFLANYEGAAAGICYSSLVTDKVPTGRFDKKVSFLITDAGVKTVK